MTNYLIYLYISSLILSSQLALLSLEDPWADAAGATCFDVLSDLSTFPLLTLFFLIMHMRKYNLGVAYHGKWLFHESIHFFTFHS